MHHSSLRASFKRFRALVTQFPGQHVEKKAADDLCDTIISRYIDERDSAHAQTSSEYARREKSSA